MQIAARTTEETATRLRRAVVQLSRRLRTERRSGSLSPNKLSVLGRLHRSGPSSPGEIATAERQRPQSLTRTFAELEREELIIRTRSQRDRREFVLTITDYGREALLRDMEERDAWLAGALETLSETERDLLGLLAPLLERVAQA